MRIKDLRFVFFLQLLPPHVQISPLSSLPCLVYQDLCWGGSALLWPVLLTAGCESILVQTRQKVFKEPFCELYFFVRLFTDLAQSDTWPSLSVSTLA